MTSEHKSPDRIWLGRDARYVGSPWLRLASCFDDEEEDGETQEYVRSDLFEASAAMCSRSNEQIDTLRAELAAEKAKSARLVDAAVYLRDDMLERAECGLDRVRGEQYRIVNAGNGAWVGFIEAIATYEVKP